MKPINMRVCATALRTITDRIYSERLTADFPATVPLMIQHVREASAWAKNAMREELQLVCPEISWSDAEADPAKQQAQERRGAYWVYDPIDGAYHYAQKLPLWSASLALMEGDATVISFVYEPSSQEMFSAKTGEGAKLNNLPIHASQKTTLADSVVATALPPFHFFDPAESAQALGSLDRVVKEVFVARMMGSASLQLAYVAAGRLDAYWEFGRDVHDWLAGAHLAREAGALLGDCTGKNFTLDSTGIVASAKELHADLSRIVTNELPGGVR